MTKTSFAAPAWRQDLPAGLVVFLVALPLCLGIALASDAPLMSGVIAGVVGGTVIGLLSGSHVSVSGPAAGLTVIVAGGIHQLGSFEALLAATVIAGGIQVALGLVRAGALATLFPSAVIRGMLAAIGIIVVLKQIPHALGRDDDYEGDLAFWFANGKENTFTDILHAIESFTPGVVIVTVVSLACLLLWEQPFIRRQAWAKVVPGPLVAVAAGTLVSQLYPFVAPHLTIDPHEGHLVSLPILASGSGVGALLTLPDFSALREAATWQVGATIAAVASIETLLSVEAADRLDPYRRTSPPNRELLAQGVGNAVSGLLGGLPVTAVIVRSSANIYAGNRTRWSAVTHAILLAVMVLAMPGLLNLIPLGTLAAVLLVVGYKLAKVSVFVEMYQRGWAQFLPFIVTVVVTVLTDLLVGVGVGLVVGVIGVIAADHHSAIVTVREGNTALVRFTRDVSFLHKLRLRTILGELPDGIEVVIDGTRAQHVDPDIQDVVETFVLAAPHRGIRVTLRDLEHKFLVKDAGAH